MRETAGSAGFRLANGAVQTFNRAQRQAFAIISALLLPDADASDEDHQVGLPASVEVHLPLLDLDLACSTCCSPR